MEPAPALSLQQASLVYGDVVALDGIDLVVRRGERVAMVGPSGAGKSSVISLANTSRRPSGGTVEVLGTAPESLSPSELRALRCKVGTVHQALHLPDALRVVHNVNAGRLGQWSVGRALGSLVAPRRRAATPDVLDALERLGIADKAWQRTDELSGGQRQRVAIARMLVQQPDLVLADEPVAALDPARGREVIELLTQQVAPETALLVSLHHYDLAVEHFDRVVGLRAGRVEFDLPAAEVRADPALGARLYDLSRG